MEWNTLLLWIAGPSCLMTLFVALQSRPMMRGWIFVALATIAVGLLTFWKYPDSAGYITGSVWAVFILAPGLIQRSAHRWTVRQRYDRAAHLSRISAVLHPFDGLWEQPRFYRAMELFEQGDVPAAVGILQGLRTAPPRIARPAMLQLCRFSNDWPELVRWVRATIKPNQLLKDPAMLPMYIRALGETGQLSEMLRTVQACSLSLHPQMTVYRGMCRMYAFVFCGQPDRAAGEMSGSLVSLPGYLKQYWIATAEQASGMNQAGDARLESIELIAPAGVARMIAVRRMNPATAAMRQLSAGDHEILHQLDRDQDQERRFVPLFHRERRPWVTYGLIAANVIMFGFEMMLGGTTNPEALFRLGAMVPGGWEAHEYYRLLAANFLHYGLAHITMNMLGLLVIGPFVEFNLGWLWYLVLYLATGILTMLSIVFFWSQHWMEPDFLVGASGAIMALIGATAAILLRGWYRERAGAVPRRLAIVAGMILLQATFDHFTPQVSGAAHMAGAAWGFLITLVLPHRKRVRPTRGFEVVPVARG